jgi:hypothetical protein
MVVVIDGRTNAEYMRFEAFTTIPEGGVYVATGDIDCDGYGDVIVGTQGLRPAQVRVFSGRRGTVLADFYAFQTTESQGATELPGRFSVTGSTVFGPSTVGLSVSARVAGGDVDGDGFADVTVGTGEGTKPTVEVYSGFALTKKQPVSKAKIASYAVSSTPSGGWTGNGVFVAAADMNGDGACEVAVSFDGSPIVSVLNGLDGTVISSIDLTTLAGGLRYGQGARIAARSGRIAIATPAGVAPTVRSLAFTMIGDQAFWVLEDISVPRLGWTGKNGVFVG